MMRTLKPAALFPAALIISCGGGCGPTDLEGPPPCGSLQYNFQTLIPGPSEPTFDASLDHKARKIDRSFHAINAHATGLNADVAVRLDDQQNRAAIEAFLTDSDSFEFAHTAT